MSVCDGKEGTKGDKTVKKRKKTGSVFTRNRKKKRRSLRGDEWRRGERERGLEQQV